MMEYLTVENIKVFLLVAGFLYCVYTEWKAKDAEDRVDTLEEVADILKKALTREEKLIGTVTGVKQPSKLFSPKMAEKVERIGGAMKYFPNAVEEAKERLKYYDKEEKKGFRLLSYKGRKLYLSDLLGIFRIFRRR